MGWVLLGIAYGYQVPPPTENPIQNPAPIQAEGKGHRVWQTAGTLLLLVPDPQATQASAP